MRRSSIALAFVLAPLAAGAQQDSVRQYAASTLCQLDQPACTITFPAGRSATLAFDVVPKTSAPVRALRLLSGPDLVDARFVLDSARGTWQGTARTVDGFRNFGTRYVAVVDTTNAVVERIPVQFLASAPRIAGVRLQRFDEAQATPDTITLAARAASTVFDVVVTGGPFSAAPGLTIEHDAIAVDADPSVDGDSVARFTARVLGGKEPPVGTVFLRVRADRLGAESARHAIVVRLAQGPSFNGVDSAAAITANDLDQKVTLTGSGFTDGLQVTGEHVVSARRVGASAVEVTFRVPRAGAPLATEVKATNVDGRSGTVRVPIRRETRRMVPLKPGARPIWAGQRTTVELLLADDAPADARFDGQAWEYAARFLDASATAQRVQEAGANRLLLEGFLDTTRAPDSVQIRRVEVTARSRADGAVPNRTWTASLPVFGPPRVDARDSVVTVYIGDSTSVLLQGPRLASLALLPSRGDVVVRAVESSPGTLRVRIVAPVGVPDGDMTLHLKRDDVQVDAVPIRVVRRPGLAGVQWRVPGARAAFAAMEGGEGGRTAWIGHRGVVQVLLPTLERGELAQELVVAILDSTGAELQRTRAVMASTPDTVSLRLVGKARGGSEVVVRVSHAWDPRVEPVERPLRVRRSVDEKTSVVGGVTVNRFGFRNAKAATLKDAFVGVGYSPDFLGSWVTFSLSAATLQADGDGYTPGAILGVRFKTLFLGLGYSGRDLEKKDPDGPVPRRTFVSLGVAGESAFSSFLR